MKSTNSGRRNDREKYSLSMGIRPLIPRLQPLIGCHPFIYLTAHTENPAEVAVLFLIVTFFLHSVRARIRKVQTRTQSVSQV